MNAHTETSTAPEGPAELILIVNLSHGRITLLSPEIIHLAIIGAPPEHISLAALRVGLPADWEEQKKVLGD